MAQFFHRCSSRFLCPRVGPPSVPVSPQWLDLCSLFWAVPSALAHAHTQTSATSPSHPPPVCKCLAPALLFLCPDQSPSHFVVLQCCLSAFTSRRALSSHSNNGKSFLSFLFFLQFRALRAPSQCLRPECGPRMKLRPLCSHVLTNAAVGIFVGWVLFFLDWKANYFPLSGCSSQLPAHPTCRDHCGSPFLHPLAIASLPQHKVETMQIGSPDLPHGRLLTITSTSLLLFFLFFFTCCSTSCTYNFDNLDVHPHLQLPPAFTACAHHSAAVPPPLPAVLLAVGSLGAALSACLFRYLLTSPPCQSPQWHATSCTPQVHMAICACFWVCAHGVRVSGVSLCFFLSFSVADLAFFFFFFPSSSPTSRVHHGPRPIFSFLFSVLFLLIGLLFLFFSFLFSFSAFCFLLSAFCFTFYFLLFTFFSFLFTFFSFTFCLTVLLSVFFFTLLLLYCFGFGVSYQIP
jgi:hypothetical protein